MKKVKLFEQFILEATEEKEAKAILQDLLDEHDPWELGDMTEEEAEETVDSYGHKGSKAKKIAKILFDLASNGIFEGKFKVGDKWEWNTTDGTKVVSITNIKPNGDIVGREDGSSEDFIVRDANKYLKKKVNEASTWKTRDGLGINNITGKSINPEVKKIIKSKNTLDGKEGKILVDTEGNIAFFENPTVAQEVADLVGGTIVNKIETKDGLTHSASSRGGSMVILESVVNEAKTLTRDELIKILKDKYSLHFTKTSEEFDGEEGGIWLGGSEGKVMPDGKTEMFNYYHGGSKFPQGINKDFANFLDKRGWYGQFADPGTVLLWPR